MKNVNVELGLIVVLNDVIYLLVKMLELNIILQIKPRVTIYTKCKLKLDVPYCLDISLFHHVSFRLYRKYFLSLPSVWCRSGFGPYLQTIRCRNCKDHPHLVRFSYGDLKQAVKSYNAHMFHSLGVSKLLFFIQLLLQCYKAQTCIKYLLLFDSMDDFKKDYPSC